MAFTYPTRDRFQGARSLVAAIVDRLTFRVHIVDTGTNSFRLRTAKKSKT